VGLLGIVVSVLATYLIATQINLAILGEVWVTARYEYVVASGVLLAVGLFTRAVRWWMLLNKGLPLGRAFSIMNVAYLVNNVLPLRIGEVARVFLATRATPPVPLLQSTSTIVVERLLDLLAVVILLIFALTAGPLPKELQSAGLAAGILAISGFLSLVFLAGHQQLAERIVDWLVNRLPILERLNPRQRLIEVLDGLAPLTQATLLGQAIGWTIFSWGLSVLAGYILMFAIYDQGDWVATSLYIAAVAFAIAVPAVPGNIGTYELSIIWALTAAGYGESTSVALAFAVMVHGLNLLVHAGAGTWGFIQEGISLEQLSQGVREIQENTD
jgi:glycosyltransferase 2 family protein